ncbi:MAG: hypothetical protein ACRDPA_18605, partial [Solirubrobacteraceae bacterium]
MLLLLPLAPHTLHAQEPAQLSPEEAAARLQPYLLPGSALPPSYSRQALVVRTPATLAALNAGDRAPVAVLQEIEAAGVLVDFSELLGPASVSAFDKTAVYAIFDVYAFASPDAATAFVQDQTLQLDGDQVSVQPASDAPQLGDLSAGYTVASASGTNPISRGVGAHLRWQQGSVAFELFGVDPSPPAVALLWQLVTALAAVETAQPPVAFTDPAITPPATEEQRLQALLRLQTIAPTSLPADFVGGGGTPVTVASYVAQAQDPQAMLQRVDGSWQRVMEVDGSYLQTPPAGPPLPAAQQVTLWWNAAEDASPAGAQADMA